MIFLTVLPKIFLWPHCSGAPGARGPRFIEPPEPPVPTPPNLSTIYSLNSRKQRACDFTKIMALRTSLAFSELALSLLLLDCVRRCRLHLSDTITMVYIIHNMFAVMFASSWQVCIWLFFGILELSRNLASRKKNHVQCCRLSPSDNNIIGVIDIRLEFFGVYWASLVVRAIYQSVHCFRDI